MKDIKEAMLLVSVGLFLQEDTRKSNKERTKMDQVCKESNVEKGRKADPLKAKGSACFE